MKLVRSETEATRSNRPRFGYSAWYGIIEQPSQRVSGYRAGGLLPIGQLIPSTLKRFRQPCIRSKGMQVYAQGPKGCSIIPYSSATHSKQPPNHRRSGPSGPWWRGWLQPSARFRPMFKRSSSAFRQCNGDLERPWGRCAVRFTCFPPASSDAAPGPLGILAGTLASFAGADGTSSRPTTCRVDCRVLS